MLNDEFLNAAREYTTKVDLTQNEIIAIDELGRTLGLGENFSGTYAAMIAHELWCFEQNWGCKNDEGQRVNTDHSLMECTLYHPIEDGGIGRMPKVHFSYWQDNPDGSKNMILDVDFIPAHLTLLQASAIGMAPVVRSHENISADSVKCEQSANIIRMLRGQELHDQPPVSLANTILRMNLQ